MNQRVLPVVIAVAAILPMKFMHASDPVKLTRFDGRVRVEIAEQLFTEYVFAGASRPYCHPVLAADGTSLTRGFPMQRTPGEDTDHPWHRGLMFEHSFIDGVDFWNEPGGDIAKSPKKKGTTVHDGIVELTSGPIGVLRVRNRYMAPDGRLICTDERTMRFHGDGDARFIDYEVTVHPRPGEPLRFGDNKDGVMSIRVAQWLTMPHRFEKAPTGGNGRIVTARGDRNLDAWGKRAEWCDYHAERNGKTYGVAIFDHPENLRHPTWWMARDYGLFAANPFGRHDFEPKTTQPGAGDYTVPAGGTLMLRYRFYFHIGDEKAAQVAERYAAYAAGG